MRCLGNNSKIIASNFSTQNPITTELQNKKKPIWRVFRHRRPVVIPRRHYLPQILELVDRLYWLPVGIEVPLRAVPQLFLLYPPSLPIRPFPAQRGGMVPPFECPDTVPACRILSTLGVGVVANVLYGHGMYMDFNTIRVMWRYIG